MSKAAKQCPDCSHPNEMHGGDGCHSTRPIIGSDYQEWCQCRRPRTLEPKPGKLKKMLGNLKDAIGNALGEAFVNR